MLTTVGLAVIVTLKSSVMITYIVSVIFIDSVNVSVTLTVSVRFTNSVLVSVTLIKSVTVSVMFDVTLTKSVTYKGKGVVVMVTVGHTVDGGDIVELLGVGSIMLILEVGNGAETWNGTDLQK